MGKGLQKKLKKKFHTSLNNPRMLQKSPYYQKTTNKAWLASTWKEIKNPIKNQTFIMDDPDMGDPATPCMGISKANIQSDGSI